MSVTLESLHLDDFHAEAAMRLRAREVSEHDLRRFEQYAAEMFVAFGMDLDTPATVNTPRRFVQAMRDATTGYDGDPKVLMSLTPSAAAARTAASARSLRARSRSTPCASTTRCPSPVMPTSAISPTSASSGSPS
jgi:hypothetical protein